ncbi:MAG TPA: hypothetical protein H9694_08855, partial [Firmicutes bacterium]|nr:hypothetical protein [Bacillota bacterium]
NTEDIYKVRTGAAGPIPIRLLLQFLADGLKKRAYPRQDCRGEAGDKRALKIVPQEGIELKNIVEIAEIFKIRLTDEFIRQVFV